MRSLRSSIPRRSSSPWELAGLRLFDSAGQVRSSTNVCANSGLTAGAASRDGDLLALGCEDGSIILKRWDGSFVRGLQRAHTKRVIGLAFAPAGQYLLSFGDDKTVLMWNPTDGTEIRRFNGGAKKPFVFGGFSSNALTVLAVTRDGQIFEWDSKTGKVLRKLSLEENSVFSAALSNSGRLLAVAGEYSALNKGSWAAQSIRRTSTVARDC